MALNIIADFFSMINVPLFDSLTVVLVASYIIWEIPRSIKVVSEEYTKGLYPENGRVIDIFLFILGGLTIVFFMMDNNAEHIVSFLRTPGITAFFLVLMLAIPLIIAMGFIKRLFSRLDGHNSVAIFLTHSFLDLMHTLFFIAFTALFVPAAGYLALGMK